MSSMIAMMMMMMVMMMVMKVVEGTGAVLVVPLVTTTGITTSATLTAAGTAAAAASLGAVALGASAVALAATRRGRTKTTYGRHRRAIGDQKAAEVLAMVASVDTQGCGMRHVCEIFSKPQSTLTPTENSIRLLVGEKPEPASPSHATHPRVLYESAAILGQHGKDCYDLYRSCPLTHAEVNEYLATLELD